ncbi:MAG: hypothetical protein JWR84_1157 [Caulobacter sp.]|nr:hypothetical protein [Caulobacter sp.]
MIRHLAVASVLLVFSASAAAAQGMNPDVNKDGLLSKAESLAAGDKGFARIDQNKNGFIDPDEQARLAKFTGGKNTLAPADFNKDGKVSKEEFVKASTFRFDQFDGNKDGKLDKAEQTALKAARGF